MNGREKIVYYIRGKKHLKKQKISYHYQRCERKTQCMARGMNTYQKCPKDKHEKIPHLGNDECLSALIVENKYHHIVQKGVKTVLQNTIDEKIMLVGDEAYLKSIKLKDS